MGETERFSMDDPRQPICSCCIATFYSTLPLHIATEARPGDTPRAYRPSLSYRIGVITNSAQARMPVCTDQPQLPVVVRIVHITRDLPHVLADLRDRSSVFARRSDSAGRSSSHPPKRLTAFAALLGQRRAPDLRAHRGAVRFAGFTPQCHRRRPAAAKPAPAAPRKRQD